MVLDGFINVDKPRDMTSHDVVAIIRRQLPKKTKVGHTGTLDPDATGVLPICVGKGTRLAEFITGLTKIYRGELTLGIVTDSQDATGKVLNVCNAAHITLADVEAVLPKFTGEIKQIPPMLSAVKVNGQKLYQLARKGEEIERKPKEITVYDLKIVSSEFGSKNPKIVLEIHCSKGTYIRSLFNDMGQALGVGGHMSALRRLGVGPFELANSYSLDAIKEEILTGEPKCFLPISMGVAHLPLLVLKGEQDYDDVSHGRTVKVNAPNMKVCRVETADGVLAAIGSVENGIMKVTKMLL